MSNIIEMKSICKSFGAVKALKNIDFAVRAGETMALVGENGAGKSSADRLPFPAPIFRLSAPSSQGLQLVLQFLHQPADMETVAHPVVHLDGQRQPAPAFFLLESAHG